MSPEESIRDASWIQIKKAMDCDPDCAWRVLVAVSNLLEVGEPIEGIVQRVKEL